MARLINEILGMGGETENPMKPIRPSRARMQWKPDMTDKLKSRHPRFNIPGPAERPEVRYFNQTDLDALIERIRAEEAQPPHKKNAALIGALKQQALQMMRELESQWVQRSADKLLPRLDENYAAA